MNIPLGRHRAQHTVEDVVLSDLPLYGLGTADFLRWWPHIVWLEGVIYQLDENNEDMAAAGRLDGASVDQGAALSSGRRYVLRKAYVGRRDIVYSRPV